MKRKKEENKNDKYIISDYSKKTQDLISRMFINNIKLHEVVELARKELNQKILTKEEYSYRLEESCCKILDEYKISYDWFGFIFDWIDSGKQPDIKKDTKITVKLFSGYEGFSSNNDEEWFPVSPEFSYVTIKTPLYADPEEVKKIFKRAQNEIISPIIPNKIIKTIKEKKENNGEKNLTIEEKYHVFELYQQGKKPKEIAKKIYKTDKPTVSQKYYINELIGNRKKQDRKFLRGE